MGEQERLVSQLEDLIQTCRDGEEGYRQAAQRVADPELREFFNDQLQQRGLFAEELERRVSHLGKHGDKPGTSVTGTLHRAWIGLKDSLGSGDNSLLASVEQGEHAAIDSYQKVLQHHLPEGLQQTVRSQLENIMAARDYVLAVRQRRKAA